MEVHRSGIFDRVRMQLISYMFDLEQFVERLGLEQLLNSPVDHVALKTRDAENYEELLRELSVGASDVSFILMNGRRIATLVLRQPFILFEIGETNVLEIMEPKPEKVGQDLIGFEHIEIYNTDLDGVVKVLEEKGVPYELGGNSYHRTVVVKINEGGQEVKFTNGRLGEIVRQQTKDGISVIIKSSGAAGQ